MKNLLNIRTTIIMALLLVATVVAAQTNLRRGKNGGSEVKHFRIYYPVNQTRLFTKYMDNAANLDTIRKHLAESPRVDSIVIYSYASPEGPFRYNSWLSKERGRTAKKHLLSIMAKDKPYPESIIRLRPEAENWQGLTDEVEAAYHRSDRDEVLRILKSDISNEKKKAALKRLDNGRTWSYLVKNIMPELRYATWISVWLPIPDEVPPADIVTTDTKMKKVPEPDLQAEAPIAQRKTMFALKTNLLYDLAAIFNASVEVPFYKNKASILYQHHFPWFNWGKSDNEYCIRFLSFGGEARWWFKPQYHHETSSRILRDKLLGHFIGIYGMGGKYDFNWKREICYQGEFWSAGLSYGYAMPIGKRLNMEFTISAGYASIPYRHYIPTEDYKQLIRDPEKQGTWNYFGLTKAEISLVLPLSFTYYKNYKKGGGNE